MSVSSSTAELQLPAPAGPPAALPRLLAGIHDDRPLTLSEHLARHGELPPAGGGGRSRSRARARELIEEVEASGLRGCGGGGFPTATKLRSVADARGRAVVVVNAVEAEPPSTKDRTLLQLAPHLVLDGAILAAEALRADEVIVATGEHAGGSAAAAYAAIEERAADGRHGRVALTLAGVKGGYVAGQESALISGLEGREALPTFTPPLPFEHGLRKRPTLVNNAETLAHVALIARHGARWFRSLGTDAHPGSALVTLGGPVVYPGVYEIEAGASLSSLIDAAGGTTRACAACSPAATPARGRPPRRSPSWCSPATDSPPPERASAPASSCCCRPTPAPWPRPCDCHVGWPPRAPASAAPASTDCPRSPRRWRGSPPANIGTPPNGACGRSSRSPPGAGPVRTPTGPCG